MIQELPERDPVDVWDPHDGGVVKPFGHRVVQRQNVLVDQLQHDDGGERFADAVDPEPIVQRERGLLFHAGDPGGSGKERLSSALNLERDAGQFRIDSGSQYGLEGVRRWGGSSDSYRQERGDGRRGDCGRRCSEKK